MITSSMRSLIVHMLLIIGAMLIMLLIAWMALQLPAAQLDWLAPTRATAAYFAWWRALLYTLIFTGWAAALRMRATPVDQQRLKRLGLIGFSSIILVELSRL
ncbi:MULTISPECIES: hypothetical protein [Pseudomonas]|jgi:hypothetical protein|uniref:Uncharacterized protein n=3 Tax=Pseudomonas putida group TaxID=136845 RepID=V9V1R5_9PSED|nr:MULTISPECIES: hypothetical protein [Pseudomonas]AFO50024.1 hypothetical protein T1E_4195 [Pseudomonas putida DOT-T1E]AHC82387.1 hypothetical protein X969_10540 [Pseudomonas monteilii SB3078]AHC87765.1 hypothetical protein X970_10200 [Pseudomonas monteilii SB3101]MDD1997082.1 hypothetical protein [Pseudomonas putida]MDD2010202.1 hypothetical protein [Pseudomonas putida]